MKGLKLITCQFWLREEIRQPHLDEIPHLHHPGMMAFNEAIMQGGASLLLHPFLIVVLQHFNVAPFQFIPNSFCIMVAFFISFIKMGISGLNVDEFTYVYEAKALAKHEGFGI